MKIRGIGKTGTRVLTSRLAGSNLLKSKRSAEKYYLVISIILGLILLIIALYWIFQEYFGEELSRETCRQSIILRNTVPDVQVSFVIFATPVIAFKDKFPLKCKTEIVDIDYKNEGENKGRAEKAFGDALASCWYALGNGAYSIFPAATWSMSSYCIVCARIHIDSSVKDYYTQNPINLKKAIDMKMSDKQTYYQYLMTSGKKSAFSHLNSWNSAGEFRANLKEGGWFQPDQVGFDIPEIFDGERGDLVIVSSSIVFNQQSTSSYLLFLPLKDISQLSNIALKLPIQGGHREFGVCDSIESIPA